MSQLPPDARPQTSEIAVSNDHLPDGRWVVELHVRPQHPSGETSKNSCLLRLSADQAQGIANALLRHAEIVRYREGHHER